MDAKNLKVGFNTLISLMFGLVSALGVWFTLRGDVNIMSIHIANLDAKIIKLEEGQKEHSKNFVELKELMHKDKLEILKAIHEHHRK